MDPQNEGAFDTVAVKCFACEDAQRVSHQMRKDNDGELYGYYWATTFSEEDEG